ncbi:MAG: hypothetical protein SchgKO_10450 [Schleiferiaceae bacterium]
MKTTKTEHESIWREKSLEFLEKNYWREPDSESYLVKTCQLLRKKPLKYFEIEDFRIMISQNIGLKFLIPIALEKLKKDILAEGDYYEGDLLKAVLTSDKEFWKPEPKLSEELESLILDKKDKLKDHEPDLLTSYTEWKMSL